MKALKLCPFCGAEPRLISASPCYWIICETCKISTRSFYSKVELEKSWNVRVSESEWQEICSSLKNECIRLSKEGNDEV